MEGREGRRGHGLGEVGGRCLLFDDTPVSIAEMEMEMERGVD